MNLRDLQLRLRALLSRRRVDRELDDELAFHLERETHRQIAAGVDPREARIRARARFGSVALAADDCRDARGTAFLDECGRDILYAWRTFRRAPLAAFTIVITVALGLGLVAVVFTALNRFVFRVDEVRNPGELFAVKRPTRPGADSWLPFTQPEYAALRRETSVFTDSFAMRGLDSRIDGRMMAGTLVTGNFFQVLGVGAARGRTLSPADDQRFAGQPIIVLSHRGWSRHFANDPAVIGRTLVVNGAPFRVVGVMPDGFRGLGVAAPDYWAPLSLLAQFQPFHTGREDMADIEIVGRLKPELTRQAALEGLLIWHAARTGGAAAAPAALRQVTISLQPRQGTVPQPAEMLLVVTPLFFAFGLILMIGCANVTNLLLARAVSRQREIGIRLALGASRRRIVRQLLTESLLLALAAAALGFAISRLVIEASVYAVTSTLATEVAEQITLNPPAADWRVGVFLVGGAIVATALFGLMPALQATRLELVRTIRGEVSRDSRPRRSRNVLIGLQVTASAVLLICSAIFLRSAMASATVDPGIRTDDVVLIEIVNEPLREAMVQAVTSEPSVVAVAASWPDGPGQSRAGVATASGVRTNVGYKFASPEYLEVLDIPILRGRGFTPAERSADTGVVVVSETVARQLYPNSEALGQVMQLEPEATSETRRVDEPPLAARTFTIVGVSRDVAGFRLADSTAAGVYVPISAAVAETTLTVRVLGDPDEARLALLRRLTAIDPNMGQVMTLRTMARMETYFLQIAFWLTIVLGGLALVLTLSGLFSVLSYLVEQRAKEIGVRMALGATMQDVGGLVLWQSVRPVGYGLVAGTGLAVALGTVLMASPAAALIGSVVRVFDPAAYAASLFCIVAACAAAAAIPAWRAARIDPIVTLRQE